MRLEDALFFSPKFKFEDLDLENTEQLIEAFEDRVLRFYFKPADKLHEDFDSFAIGTLTLAAIDFIGYFLYRTSNSDRIKKFCGELKTIKGRPVDEVDEITKRINEDYRNGLIHEGRIKRFGQFGTDINCLIEIRDDFSIINPKLLLKEMKALFQEKLRTLRSSKEDKCQFKKRFHEAFKNEIG